MPACIRRVVPRFGSRAGRGVNHHCLGVELRSRDAVERRLGADGQESFFVESFQMVDDAKRLGIKVLGATPRQSDLWEEMKELKEYGDYAISLNSHCSHGRNYTAEGICGKKFKDWRKWGLRYFTLSENLNHTYCKLLNW